jgi:hypothetical protein
MGRPPLGEERLRLPGYGTEEDLERLRALAEKWRCSRSAAIRRAIAEAARREKVTP